MTLKIAAIYARFSDDTQRPTSIADQVRNAQALAESKGYHVPPEFIFTDEGVSGQWKSLDKRTGYAELQKAWEAGKFSAVFADEATRLARDKLESALLERRVQTSGVHIFTVDGLDSTRNGWSLLFGIKAVIAAEDLAAYAQRSRRGMLGAVLRGYQVGTPPFGYRAHKVLQGVEVLGTRFEVFEDEAQYVRLAFQLRAAGKSLNDIAEELNRRGAPARTKSAKVRARGTSAPWTAPTIAALLGTPYYAGFFMYPVRDEVSGKVTDTRFEREHLRIVSDELFYAVTARKGVKFTPQRAGVKHFLAGLVRCGVCGTAMRLQYDPKRNGPALRCAKCEAQRQAGVDIEVPYVSSVGLEIAMKDAVRLSLTPEVAEIFRARLLQRLTGGVDAEIAQAKQEVARLDAAATRLARLLGSLDKDDLILEAQYRRLAAEKQEAARKLARLQSGSAIVDKAALEKQLAVNPVKLVDRVFSTSDPAALGARLRRFFNSVTLVSKPDRFTTVFSLCVVPGAIAAELTSTATLDTTPTCLTYVVKQRRVKGGRVEWDVTRTGVPELEPV